MPIQQQDTIGDLTKLIGLVKGPSTTTSSSSNISKEGMQGLINQILGGSQGLATVAQGQKAAGLYGSTTNQMLTNDLITRSSQQLAAAQAGTTTTQKSAAPISGQNLLQMLLLGGVNSLAGPTIKKGIKKTGLEDMGERIANTLFPDGASAGIGSTAGSVGIPSGELLSSLSAFGNSLTASDVAATATGLDISGATGNAALGGVGDFAAGGITAASLAPELTSSLAAYGSTLTAGEVAGTALGLDIAGMTAGAGTAAALGTGAEIAGTVAAGAEGAGILASIGAAIAEAIPVLGALFSDERLKTDVKPVGKTEEGQTIYTYKYKGDPIRTHMGVMAQETLKFHPEAVVKHPSGALMVNYDKILGVD